MYKERIEEIKEIKIDELVFDKIRLDLISSLENSSKGDEIIKRIDNRINWLNKNFFNNSFRSIIFPPVAEVVNLMNDFNSYIKLDEGKQILIDTIKKTFSEITALLKRCDKKAEELRLDYSKLVDDYDKLSAKYSKMESLIKVVEEAEEEPKEETKLDKNKNTRR